MPTPSIQDRNAELVQQIRAHVAFEHMIVAVLAGSALCGAGMLVIENAMLLSAGVWSFAGLVRVLMSSLLFAFLIFLIGFAASVALGGPLFLALERAKIRKLWPYVGAALAVNLVVIMILFGSGSLLDKPQSLVFLAPGAVIALLFGRGVKPLWRAAERAETAPTIFRIH